MKSFVLPDEIVKKVTFIANVFELKEGFRLPDIAIIHGAVSMLFDDVALSIGHGVCDGGDEV